MKNKIIILILAFIPLFAKGGYLDKILNAGNDAERLEILKKIPPQKMSYNLFYLYAKLLIKNDKYTEAKKILRKMMKIVSTPEIYLLYTDIYKNAPEKELLVLQEALKNTNAYDKTLNLRIVNTCFKLKKEKLAEYYILKYLKMYPHDIDMNILLEKAFIKKGDIDTAETILKNLLLFYPDNINIKKELNRLSLF